MRNKDDLINGMKLVMVKMWNLKPNTNETEIAHYASGLADRILANDTRYTLDLHARDIQVNWLRLPESKDYTEVVDWSLALARSLGLVS